MERVTPNRGAPDEWIAAAVEATAARAKAANFIVALIIVSPSVPSTRMLVAQAFDFKATE